MKYGESTFDLLYLAFASDAWNADASEDGMLYTYADFFYQEGAK